MGSVCRGADGPTAVHTKLGWVLSGPSFHDELGRCAVNLNVTHVLHAEPCTLDAEHSGNCEAMGI